MADFIIAGILIIVVGIAVAYIVKAKRKGVKCIGCPASGHCSAKQEAHSACSCGADNGCHCEEHGGCSCHKEA